MSDAGDQGRTEMMLLRIESSSLGAAKKDYETLNKDI